MIPFSAEGYAALLANYGLAIWPAQIAAGLLAALALFLSLRPLASWRRLAAWILAALWLWTGLIFHGQHLAALVWAAWAFAALFVLQALLIAAADLRGSLRFEGAGRGWLAVALAGLALLLEFRGLWDAGPISFVLQPAPLTLFTFALFLTAGRQAPLYLWLVPALWALVAAAVAWELGTWQDIVLPVAGLVSIWFRLRAPS